MSNKCYILLFCVVSSLLTIQAMQEENRLKLYEDKIRKSQNESEYKKAVQKYYIKAQELNLWD